LSWLEANAEELPLADASVDSYTIAFGLRNVTRPEVALAQAARVLRPGGRLLVLEFSHVEFEPLRAAYDAYSFAAIPAMGRLVTGDAAPYQYLVESIRQFATQDELADMMRVRVTARRVRSAQQRCAHACSARAGGGPEQRELRKHTGRRGGAALRLQAVTRHRTVSVDRPVARSRCIAHRTRVTGG
jgi:SAM-dependent methyltransferase